MLLTRRLASSVASPIQPRDLNLNFVPKHQPPTLKDVEKLQNFVDEHSRIFVVTGTHFKMMLFKRLHELNKRN